MRVGETCRRADRFLAEKAATSSPLLKAQLFERSQQHTHELAALRRELSATREQLEAELKTLDGHWQSVNDAKRVELLARLEDLHRLFGFFDRWLTQVQERFVQLAF